MAIDCPHFGKWFHGCRFEGRYSVGASNMARIRSCSPADAARVIEASKPRTYVHDICIRCGRIAVPTPGERHGG